MQLDIDYIRRQFPALTEGKFKDIAFFENAGGTYVPYHVLNYLNQFLIESKVQPYAPYAMSVQATKMIESATIKMAEMVNANSSEVMIGHCTTMNLYLLSKSLLGWLTSGDEIIVTNQDHESNISPWRNLQKQGIVIKEWGLNPNSGELEIETLEPLLNTKTRLVCMNHCSNIIGSVNDIKTVAKLVHEKDALLLVDGVSYAPHHAIDVKELDVDIYALSLYKVFGPHQGLLYVKEDHHDKIANQSLEFMPALYSKLTQDGAPNSLRIALNPGLVNHEEAASLLGLVDYFNAIYQYHSKGTAKSFFECICQVFKLFENHESILAERFLTYVNTKNNIKLIGQAETDTRKRSPTFSFVVNNKNTPLEVASLLGQKNIAVQAGCFYAWRCLNALGINPDEGVLRISMAHFNSVEDVDKLIEAIESVI